MSSHRADKDPGFGLRASFVERYPLLATPSVCAELRDDASDVDADPMREPPLVDVERESMCKLELHVAQGRGDQTVEGTGLTPLARHDDVDRVGARGD